MRMCETQTYVDVNASCTQTYNSTSEPKTLDAGEEVELDKNQVLSRIFSDPYTKHCVYLYEQNFSDGYMMEENQASTKQYSDAISNTDTSYPLRYSTEEEKQIWRQYLQLKMENEQATKKQSKKVKKYRNKFYENLVYRTSKRVSFFKNVRSFFSLGEWKWTVLNICFILCKIQVQCFLIYYVTL